MKGAIALRRTVGTPIANDNSGTTITSAAYVQLSASLAATASAIEVFNTSSKGIKLALGAAGHEVDFYIIPPSSAGSIVPVQIALGQALSAKALGADATTGFVVVNFLG